jgi:hypothetical protein
MVCEASYLRIDSVMKVYATRRERNESDCAMDIERSECNCVSEVCRCDYTYSTVRYNAKSHLLKYRPAETVELVLIGLTNCIIGLDISPFRDGTRNNRILRTSSFEMVQSPLS